MQRNRLSQSAISRTQALEHMENIGQASCCHYLGSSCCQETFSPSRFIGSFGGWRGWSTKARWDRCGEERLGGPPVAYHTFANRMVWVAARMYWGVIDSYAEWRRNRPWRGLLRWWWTWAPPRNPPSEPFRQNEAPVVPWTQVMRPRLWPLQSQWVSGWTWDWANLGRVKQTATLSGSAVCIAFLWMTVKFFAIYKQNTFEIWQYF